MYMKEGRGIGSSLDPIIDQAATNVLPGINEPVAEITHPTLKIVTATKPRNDAHLSPLQMWGHIMSSEATRFARSWGIDSPLTWSVQDLSPSSNKNKSRILFVMTEAAAAHTNQVLLSGKQAAHFIVWFSKIDSDGKRDPAFSNVELMKLLAQKTEFSRQVAQTIGAVQTFAAELMRSDLQLAFPDTNEQLQFRLHVGSRTSQEAASGKLGVSPQSSQVGHFNLGAQPECEKRPSHKAKLSEKEILKIMDPLPELLPLYSVFSALTNKILSEREYLHLKRKVIINHDSITIHVKNGIPLPIANKLIGRIYQALDDIRENATMFYNAMVLEVQPLDHMNQMQEKIVDIFSKYGLNRQTSINLLENVILLQPTYSQVFDQELITTNRLLNTPDKKRQRKLNKLRKIYARDNGDEAENEENVEQNPLRPARRSDHLSEQISCLAKKYYEQTELIEFLDENQQDIAPIRDTLIKLYEKDKSQQDENPELNSWDSHTWYVWLIGERAKTGDRLISLKKREIKVAIVRQARQNPKNFTQMNAIFPLTKLTAVATISGLSYSRSAFPNEMTASTITVTPVSSGRGALEILGINPIRQRPN